MSMKSKISFKDISFVVQGPVDCRHTPACIKSIRKHFPGSPVIISTWQGSDVSELDYDSAVFSEDPGGFVFELSPKSFNNVNRQIVSSFEGLKQVATPYAVKIRSDEALFSNKFVKYMQKFPKRSDKYVVFENRIVTYCFTSKFFNLTETTPFNVSDWFYFGRTADLVMLFDIPLNKDSDMLYFANLYPDNMPLKGCSLSPYRYFPEQYIGYTKFSQIYENAGFDHRFCNDEKIQDISKHFIANNFVMLNHSQLPVYFLKRDLCEYFGYPYYYWSHAITFFRWEELYKKYCDREYRLHSLKNSIHNLIIKFIYKSGFQSVLRIKFRRKLAKYDKSYLEGTKSYYSVFKNAIKTKIRNIFIKLNPTYKAAFETRENAKALFLTIKRCEHWQREYNNNLRELSNTLNRILADGHGSGNN